MLKTWEEMTVVFDLVLIVAIGVLVAFIGWLANDLLWDRWEHEQEKRDARRLTWLIAANLVATVGAGIGLALLALRTSVW